MSDLQNDIQKYLNEEKLLGTRLGSRCLLHLAEKKNPNKNKWG